MAVDKPSAQAVRSMTMRHYDAFFEAIVEMERRGLSPDTHVSNFFYEKSAGLTIVDYFRTDHDPVEIRLLNTAMTQYIFFLVNIVAEAGLSSDGAYRRAWHQSFKKGLGVALKRDPHAVESLPMIYKFERSVIQDVDSILS